MRTKVLAAFLSGLLTMWLVLRCVAWVVSVEQRLGAVEGWINGLSMLMQMHPAEPQSAPQSHKEPSHKGELSKPQRWEI